MPVLLQQPPGEETRSFPDPKTALELSHTLPESVLHQLGRQSAVGKKVGLRRSGELLAPKRSFGSSDNSPKEVYLTSFDKHDLKPSAGFIILESWEGQIIEICEGNIKAEIESLRGADIRRGTIEFQIEELGSFDWELVKVGALFYWYIGYDDKSNGQRVRSSVFRMRRFPIYSKYASSNLTKNAQAIYEYFQ